MSPHKRPPHPMLRLARLYLRRRAPTFRPRRLRLRQLAGPPDGPRFAVTAETCARDGNCPYDVDEPSRCTVSSCANRWAIGMLLSQKGQLLQLTDDRAAEDAH